MECTKEFAGAFIPSGGWGALDLPSEEATKISNDFEDWVAEALNFYQKHQAEQL